MKKEMSLRSLTRKTSDVDQKEGSTGHLSSFRREHPGRSYQSKNEDILSGERMKNLVILIRQMVLLNASRLLDKRSGRHNHKGC